MDAEQLLKMVSLLTAKSQAGLVEWEKATGLFGESYICKLADLSVSISQTGHSGLGSARIIIKNAPGEEILSVAEGDFIMAGQGVIKRPIRVGSELSQLYMMARNSSNQSGGAILKIISELEKL